MKQSFYTITAKPVYAIAWKTMLGFLALINMFASPVAFEYFRTKGNTEYELLIFAWWAGNTLLFLHINRAWYERVSNA